jgi:hypothetical protein
MPIWLELMILLLFAYGIGLAIGWAIWGGPGNQLRERGE